MEIFRIVFCYFFNCVLSSENGTALPWKAKLDNSSLIPGIQHRSDNLTMETLDFEEGQWLQKNCSFNNSTHTIHWIHEKDGQELFAGNATTELASIKMRLYNFDTRSSLSCVLKEIDSESEEIRLKIIDLRLKANTSSPKISHSLMPKNKGESFETNCNRDVLAVKNGNILTHQPRKFYVTESDYGMTIFCIDVTTENRTTKRVLNHFLTITKPSDKLLENASNTRDNINSDILSRSKSPPSQVAYIAAAVGGLLLIFISIILIVKLKRRVQTTQGVNEHTDPIYASAQQVVYAELLLQVDSRANVCRRDDTPYAKVIGVLTPKYK